MSNAKILETRVVVALAQILAGYTAPEGSNVRRACTDAVMQAAVAQGKLEAVVTLVDLASALDDLAMRQIADADQLGRDLQRNAERVAVNPTACVTNPLGSSLALAITERAVRITEKTEALATMARIALGAEVAQAMANALRGA